MNRSYGKFELRCERTHRETHLCRIIYDVDNNEVLNLLLLLLLLLWGTSQSKVALANARDLTVVMLKGFIFVQCLGAG